MSSDPKPTPSSVSPLVKHRDHGLRIFTYPKVIFIFPTMVTALICGGSRYRMARAELRKLSQYSRTAVLAIVSSAVGSHVGPYGYVVPPLVAILLGLISQVGLNAWCAGRR